MTIFRKIYDWFLSRNKKVSVKDQISEWFKTVPKLPKITRELSEFDCRKCGTKFRDNSTRFERVVLNKKTGEYTIDIIPDNQILCHKCYPTAPEIGTINGNNLLENR